MLINTFQQSDRIILRRLLHLGVINLEGMRAWRQQQRAAFASVEGVCAC